MFLSMCLCGYMNLSPKVGDRFLELEFLEAVSHLTWVLGAKLRSLWMIYEHLYSLNHLSSPKPFLMRVIDEIILFLSLFKCFFLIFAFHHFPAWWDLALRSRIFLCSLFFAEEYAHMDNCAINLLSTVPFQCGWQPGMVAYASLISVFRGRSRLISLSLRLVCIASFILARAT